ncbi:MAG: DUF5320 domain-containing protein [Elusimicrobia bacterium]|nr:DUF5320 domain-containing protein [Elusimicrobiota bacterium]
MPFGDGTGPRGEGPMTGWGMGYCVVPLSGSAGGRISYGRTGRYRTSVTRMHPYRSTVSYWEPRFGIRLGRGWFGFGRGRGFGRRGWFGNGRGWSRGKNFVQGYGM